MHFDGRQKKRRLLCEQVVCTQGSSRWQAFLANISASGAFVESSSIPQMGEEVALEFSLLFVTQKLRVRFNLKGLIVRTQASNDPETKYLTPSGFSAHFVQLTAKEFEWLETFAAQSICASQ